MSEEVSSKNHSKLKAAAFAATLLVSACTSKEAIGSSTPSTDPSVVSSVVSPSSAASSTSTHETSKTVAPKPTDIDAHPSALVTYAPKPSPTASSETSQSPEAQANAIAAEWTQRIRNKEPLPMGFANHQLIYTQPGVDPSSVKFDTQNEVALGTTLSNGQKQYFYVEGSGDVANYTVVPINPLWVKNDGLMSPIVAQQTMHEQNGPATLSVVTESAVVFVGIDGIASVGLTLSNGQHVSPYIGHNNDIDAEVISG